MGADLADLYVCGRLPWRRLVIFGGVEDYPASGRL